MVSASRILDEQGPMTSRNIVYHLSDFDGRNKSLTTQKIGAMLIRRGDTFVTAEDILFGLGLEVAKIERRHQARVSECMGRLGWEPGR